MILSDKVESFDLCFSDGKESRIFACSWRAGFQLTSVDAASTHTTAGMMFDKALISVIWRVSEA